MVFNPNPHNWPGGVPPPGWRGGPLTPQNDPRVTGHSGHAQYDPWIYEQWRQQHPNDPRQYAGPEALPDWERDKWYAAQGHEQRQKAIVKQANSPNAGGQQPLPQGGLSRSTPGIEAYEDPIWGVRGKTAYENQAARNREMEARFNWPGGIPGDPTTPTQTAAPDFANVNSQLRGKPAGTEIVIAGRRYRINENGAIIDITDPNNRIRTTNRAGIGLPQNYGSGLESTAQFLATQTGGGGAGGGVVGPGQTPPPPQPGAGRVIHHTQSGEALDPRFGATQGPVAPGPGPGGSYGGGAGFVPTGPTTAPLTYDNMGNVPTYGGYQNYDPTGPGYINTRSPGYGTYSPPPPYAGPIFGPAPRR